MKLNRIFTLIAIVVVAITLSGLGFFLIPGEAYAQQSRIDSFRKRPLEITRKNFETLPQKVLLDTDVLEFNDVVWRTFITLNWPVDSSGEPLSGEAFGSNPTSRRMWELYRTPEEVFGSEPKTDQFCQNRDNQELLQPSARLARPTIPPTIPLVLAEGRTLALEQDLQNIRTQTEPALAKTLNAEQWAANFTVGETAKRFKPELPNAYPLIDQQGNYVLLESYINQAECEQIVNQQWYKREPLKNYSNEPSQRFQFNSSSSTDAPVEVKVAWRVFSDDINPPEQRSRYYVTKRLLSIPAESYCKDNAHCGSNNSEPTEVEVEVGLIGFHIMYKIPQQQRERGEKVPGWIFATFEQVDNLETPEVEGFTLKPTLFNPDCSESDCSPNEPKAKLPYLWQVQAPHAVTYKDGTIMEQIPTQVKRIDGTSGDRDLDNDTKKDLNEQNLDWKEAFTRQNKDSIWQYYQPIGIQWLADPATIADAPSNNLLQQIRQKSKPGPLVNVTMEPYHQKQRFGDSCIACHANARLPNGAFSDFSFLLRMAKE